MAGEMGAARVTLSPEDVLRNMKSMAAASPLPVVLPVYADVPLFISADCIRSNACADCPRGEKVAGADPGRRSIQGVVTRLPDYAV